MLKMTIAAMLFATTATAGDYLEGYYFYVVGSVRSKIPMTNTNNIAKSASRQKLAHLRHEWSKKCEVPVWFWHTNLMGNSSDTAKWTPGYWFAFIAMEQTKDEMLAATPETPCAAQGYVKQGNMLIPGIYYHCITPDPDNPDSVPQYCK